MCGIKMHVKDGHTELKSFHSIKKDNEKWTDYCYVIGNKGRESSEVATFEDDQTRTFISSCNLDEKIKLKESCKGIGNCDEVSVSVEKYDEKDFDNSKENISAKCDENKENVNEESDENQGKVDEKSDKDKENVIEDSNEFKNNVNEYCAEEQQNRIEVSDENQEEVNEESDTKKENVIEASNDYRNRVNEDSLEEQENEIEKSDEYQGKEIEESDTNKENVVEDSYDYRNKVNEYSLEEQENKVKKSNENQGKEIEESDKNNESIIEDCNKNKNNDNEYSVEEEENVNEESDEDQENYLEKFGDQIRAHGPMKTLFKTHAKKPYPMKCESHNSHTFPPSITSQSIERYSSSSENLLDDYSNASYSDSGYTSSPSTSHSFDDLEENADEKIVNDELSEAHDEIANFLQSIETSELLNLVENTFEERFLQNYSTKYASYEDNLRERNIVVNEILENIFDDETSMKYFPKQSTLECRIRENGHLSFNNDSYNESLLEMFGNEAILQTVEANVNSRASLLPNEINFNLPENHSFTTISPTTTLPITQTENYSSQELPVGSVTSGIESLSINNIATTNSRCPPNINECSSRSLPHSILQTVEAKVNSRANLLPKQSNFNLPEAHSFTTISPTTTIPIIQIQNCNFQELPVGPITLGNENLSVNNIDTTNPRCLPNNNESSSRSLSNNLETTVQNAQNENFCDSANSNCTSKKSKKIKKKKNPSTNTSSKQESSRVPLKCKDTNGFSKQILRSILHNERLLLSLRKNYKRIQETKDDIIYVTKHRDSEGQPLNLTNLHIAVMNSDLEEIYAIVEMHKQYKKPFADINRKDNIFEKVRRKFYHR
ncbi:MATH and LRR domain-containing protein PFE0570w-like [Uloborus diversus]|uniref:MATH and LRR domain-containing protein PFE0570w-like n=1 Tax=Uloborus diversus TaxID=327109 RepID=UPI0024092682|nr:MATH and LRR domain-containing protein PFE0570w-like [Uloborus diversus]